MSVNDLKKNLFLISCREKFLLERQKKYKYSINKARVTFLIGLSSAGVFMGLLFHLSVNLCV